MDATSNRNMVARIGASLCFFACICGPASGQSDSEAGVAPPTNEYVKGHAWLSGGLGTPIESIASGSSGSLLALTQDGRVFRQGNQTTWLEVLGASRVRLEEPGEVDDEALLLDVEGFLEESEDLTRAEFRSAETDEESSDENAEEDASPDPAESIDDRVETVDIFATDTHSDGAGMAPVSGRVIWKSETQQGLALVARRDGVWRSDDDGYTWARSETLPPAHAFIDGPTGDILAGTTRGVRISKDAGRTWRELNDSISHIETFCFAFDEGMYFAGTSEGLMVSPEGQKWAKPLSRHDSDIPVWAIAVDEFWDRGLWVVGPVGILRSDNGGEQLRSAGQNTLIGTVTLLPLDRPGHILAGGVDGVWESSDGGLRWRPIVNGLPSPASRLLVNTLNGPLVAGNDGVYRLERAAEEVVELSIEAYTEPPGAELPALVHVALTRPGMAMTEILSSSIVANAMLLPKLTINGKMDRNRSIQADYDSESNTGSMRRSWSIGVTACFGSCGSSLGFSDVADSGLYDVDALSGGSDAVTVVGGEVYGAAESGSIAPMAANVAERGTRYRTDIAGVVSELVLARHRLLEARSVVQTLSLREQVSHELDILESAARLDVYTNGYFSRVLEGS